MAPNTRAKLRNVVLKRASCTGHVQASVDLIDNEWRIARQGVRKVTCLKERFGVVTVHPTKVVIRNARHREGVLRFVAVSRQRGAKRIHLALRSRKVCGDKVIGLLA